MGRHDPNTSILGEGGHEHVLLNVEVNELSQTHRISAMEQNARLATLHHNQQFQLAVRQRQAVFDSSARFEMTLSLELSQAQLNNEPAVQHRERYVLSTWLRSSRRTSAAKSPDGARATPAR